MRDLFPPLPSSSYSVGMTRSEIPLFCWPFSLLAGPACAGAKAQSGAKTIQIGQSQSPIGRCSARHELVHHCRMLLGVFYSWMGLETNLDVGKLANPHVGIPCSDLQCSYLFISAIDVLRLLLILGHNALSAGQFVRRYTPISHLRIPPCESQVVVVYPSGAVRSSMHASVLTRLSNQDNRVGEFLTEALPRCCPCTSPPSRKLTAILSGLSQSISWSAGPRQRQPLSPAVSVAGRSVPVRVQIRVQNCTACTRADVNDAKNSCEGIACSAAGGDRSATPPWCH
jgi:hypothetical protein